MAQLQQIRNFIPPTQYVELIRGLQSMRSSIRHLLGHPTGSSGRYQYQSPLLSTGMNAEWMHGYTYVRYLFNLGTSGRPMCQVNNTLLQQLHDLHFTVTEMAALLGVSPRTVARRLANLNMTIRSRYASIPDQNLDDIIQDIQRDYPNIGYRMMRSVLAARGVYIQERRVRDSLRRVDPLGTTLRWANSVRRRSYRVPCPNALWHIDGYHALIRWKLVVHGGIDGYSRLVVFLKCSTNNRADTVLNLFITACNSLGIPSRVRSDRGGENVLVATFMVLYHGSGRGSHIAGSSVHNQRVERLWRDLYTMCISIFYHLFYFLEDAELLDPENDVHLYCLHYVYVPRVNAALQMFCESWNQHPLTSCHSMSPQQMWTRGMLQNMHSGYTAVEDCFLMNCTLPTLASLGNISGLDTETVEIHPTRISLSSDDLEDLQSTIQPLRDSSCWGVDIYLETISFVESTLH